MSGEFSVELTHCRELAMPPGSLFEFTSRYLPVKRREQLLSLYALKQAVTSIPLTAVDDSVKWSKLKWWSEELTAEPSAAARHPVLRAMYKSGARTHLKDGLLQKLVSDAVMQMDAFPDAEKETLYGRLAAKGETDILLELALDAVEIDPQNLKLLSLATGLFDMISGFLPDYQQRIQQLPLDLLARYQVSASCLEQNPPATELLEIIAQLASDGVESYDEGIAVLGSSSGTSIPTHLQLRWAMEARRLSRISKSTRASFDNLSPYGPSDAWFAWKFCRKSKHS